MSIATQDREYVLSRLKVWQSHGTGVITTKSLEQDTRKFVTMGSRISLLQVSSCQPKMQDMLRKRKYGCEGKNLEAQTLELLNKDTKPAINIFNEPVIAVSKEPKEVALLTK